jgi:hypothetical protein
MKKTLLSTILKDSVKMNPKEVENFFERAEPNPFLNRRSSGGLDKLVRRDTNINLDVDDIDYDDHSAYVDWEDEQMHDDDDHNRRYVLPHKNKSYKRNEYNQDSDIDDIDLDVGDEFMRNLDSDDDYYDDDYYDDDYYDDDYYDDDPMFDEDYDEYDGEFDDDDLTDDEFDRLLNSDDEDPTDEFSDDEESDDEESDEFSDLDPEEADNDGKYQGVIRSVKGAYLITKLQQADETYTEIWMYNVGKNFDDEANIRKSILSSTDIDPTKSFSEDGSQEAIIKTVGNVQFLTITGLPD